MGSSLGYLKSKVFIFSILLQEAERREAEETRKREEEARLKAEKEIADMKAKEEAEKLRKENEERLRKEEEARIERKKRVEAIMSRTRGAKQVSSIPKYIPEHEIL